MQRIRSNVKIFSTSENTGPSHLTGFEVHRDLAHDKEEAEGLAQVTVGVVHLFLIWARIYQTSPSRPSRADRYISGSFCSV